ncbi:3'(2'),5'-bisphosphate nucleotidase CysQ [Gordonia McavH-238-E]|uniref:3'(2'),5'-bisphosphate nucleotidase CysQ n=1 Tax=Gordonia sp. McavH-238-E TaxID=2917736 RepID=UPI001EF6AD11|nr:3'(2'),5'-bisphosphate nucleotidase CysQ [Gordonia sp. McavH-238-E]MCG7631807.1 3'(2'),5'-bisphosphate nucleotidase CysQ [Gordonia sp. McavH-238-E]
MTADRRLARELASSAGELLVRLRSTSGLSGKALGKEGDARSNALLLEILARERPGDLVLSEESTDDKRRLDADRVWIVDPVDGTREYGTEGRVDWAVHVALWSADADLIAGAVALPALGIVYTDDYPPAVPGGDSSNCPKDRAPRIVVSASRPPLFSDAVAQALGGDVLPMGSAGAKAMAVVRGEADAYVHAGGQYEWDSAAPVAVARAKGLWCGRIDGSPLRYNQDDTYLPDVIICRPELTEKILSVTTAHSPAGA